MARNFLQTPLLPKTGEKVFTTLLPENGFSVFPTTTILGAIRIFEKSSWYV